ncbi:MAG TPA: GTPase [Patescibacteria group bacterium]|nr:GTPase [Patescibacteria group bacterium]
MKTRQNFVRVKKSKHDSSMKTRSRTLKNIKRQRGKYPILAENIVQMSDIILEILDLRFVKETRNPEIEGMIEKQGKKIIYVFNKSDLIDREKIDREYVSKLRPGVFVSCINRKGIKDLRDRIKAVSSQIKYPVDKFQGKVTVGVVGYPNTGKSSVINLLSGRSVARVSTEAGFTKGIQKVNLTSNVVLLDSPGIIPNREYSSSNVKLMSRHTRVGARSSNQIKDPEIAATDLIMELPGVFEKYYDLSVDGDPEMLLEELGRKKGFLKKGNEVNTDQAARLILKDWQEGRIKK